MRTKTLLLLISLLATTGLFAQDQGYLDGKVFFKDKNEPAWNAQVRVFQGTSLIIGAVTDTTGFFRIKPLNPGKYQVVISYVGYHTDTIINVPIKSGQATDIATHEMTPNSMLKEFQVVEYVEPLINKGGGMIHTLDATQLETLPAPNDVVSNLQFISSEFQVEPGTREIHFRGSRDGETAFYVDGVRVESPNGIPRFAMSSMKVYAGGVPARYGDFTGGVVVVETKSYFDWEQEERQRMLAYERSRIVKRPKVEAKPDETPTEPTPAEENNSESEENGSEKKEATPNKKNV